MHCALGVICSSKLRARKAYIRNAANLLMQAFKKLAKYLELGSVYELLKNEKLVKVGAKVFKYLGG